MISAIHLRVTGKVQGVFFRAKTRQMATELELTGWVKNTDDGAVGIHAEGSKKSLEQFAAWCHHGPPAARVESVKIQNAKPGGYSSFEITS
jgi:acylphosphatase